MDSKVINKMFDAQKAFAKTVTFKEAHPAIDQYYDTLGKLAEANAKKFSIATFASFIEQPVEKFHEMNGNKNRLPL